MVLENKEDQNILYDYLTKTFHHFATSLIKKKNKTNHLNTTIEIIQLPVSKILHSNAFDYLSVIGIFLNFKISQLYTALHFWI